MGSANFVAEHNLVENLWSQTDLYKKVGRPLSRFERCHQSRLNHSRRYLVLWIELGKVIVKQAQIDLMPRVTQPIRFAMLS